MKKIIALASLSTLALLLNINSHAEIYKWTDAKGGVHYTATPPVQKTKRIKATDIEDKIRTAAGKYRASVKTESTDIDVADSTSENSDDENLSGPDKKLVKYCENQRNNLAQLKKNYRNVWVDVKGKKTTLDQEQRKVKVNYLKTRIKEDCADVKAG